MTKEEIDALVQFATPRQLQILEAIKKHGTYQKASIALGLTSSSTIPESVAAVRRKAAKMGYSPDHDMTRTVPDGFKVRGVSTYYNKDGKPAGQWVKSAVDNDRQAEIAKAAIQAMTSEITGMSPLVDPPKQVSQDILAVYPMGDPHIGLHCWGKETGEDFDLKEAERVTMGAIDRLVAVAPGAQHAILLPLGDCFHLDDQTNTTPAHKNQLDVDTRYQKIIEIGIRMFRYAILRLMQKHEFVTVRFVKGNHDPHSVMALAYAISAYFDNDPRVTIDLSPREHWFYRFGKNLIGATHGDKCKPETLMGVMAVDRAKDWGETAYRYYYCGHVHHSSMKEFPGMTVETVRTLAAADAYAVGRGYRAGRDMRCIVLHKEYGEIERHNCDIAMV